MAQKKDSKAPKKSSPAQKEQRRDLLDKHPFETMSQVQNRYGSGRKQPGSDGTTQDSRGSNH